MMLRVGIGSWIKKSNSAFLSTGPGALRGWASSAAGTVGEQWEAETPWKDQYSQATEGNTHHGHGTPNRNCFRVPTVYQNIITVS